MNKCKARVTTASLFFRSVSAFYSSFSVHMVSSRLTVTQEGQKTLLLTVDMVTAKWRWCHYWKLTFVFFSPVMLRLVENILKLGFYKRLDASDTLYDIIFLYTCINMPTSFCILNASLTVNLINLVIAILLTILRAWIFSFISEIIIFILNCMKFQTTDLRTFANSMIYSLLNHSGS